MDILSGKEDEYEHKMLDIMYVVNNIPGAGISIDEFESVFSVGCKCVSDCTQGNCSCVRECVNYIDNRFNEEKSSKLILECNPQCLCSNNCQNKLVQCGPVDCLEVIEIEGKGFGLITNKFIGKNQFICEYAGEIIGIDEAKKRIEENKKLNKMNYILVVSEYIGEKKITTCIDPTYFGNIGRYSNHSCQPNAKLVPVRIESLIPHLSLFACRDIDIGEEITFDYAGGNIVNVANCLSDTPCQCNSDKCIGFLPHHPI